MERGRGRRRCGPSSPCRLLSGSRPKADAARWIDQPGLPGGAPEAKSRRRDELRAMEERPLDVTPTELLVFLQGIQSPAEGRLRELDARFGLSARKSLELRHTFVLLQLRAGMNEGIEGARRVVSETGRMKYLRPVYQQLARADRAVARKTFEEFRATYHPIARSVVEGLLR